MKNNTQAFENGRKKALREIESKLAAARGEELSSTRHEDEYIANQRFANAAPRTPQERLGFGNREEEVGRERQAFANAAKASQSRGGFFIPTPQEVRAMMARSKTARAEAHRTVIENQAAARKRLGLGKKDD